jgi:hypothetical protein
MQRFDEVHCFDWSGSKAHHSRVRGIACAWGQVGAAPRIRSGWSRDSVLAHCLELAHRARNEGRSILLGFDFALSFPFNIKRGTFFNGQRTRAGLWRTLRRRIWTRSKFPARFYANTFKSHFHLSGPCIETCRQFRFTERIAKAEGANPKSVFHCVGAQVGPGSLCGIAMLDVLRVLCRRGQVPLTVWPLFRMDEKGREHPISVHGQQPTPCLAVAETYPSLYWRQAHCSSRDWSNPIAWRHVRSTFGGKAPGRPPRSEDEGDALVAWYALSSPQASLMAPMGPTVASEGWIAGLPHPRRQNGRAR